MKQIIEGIRFASYFSALPAIWIGRRLRGLLWFYVCASFLCDITSVTLTYLGYKTKICGNIFYMFELPLVGVYFCKVLFRGWVQKCFLFVVALLTAAYALDSISNLHTKINREYLSFAMALFVLFCLIALYQVIRNIEHLKIEHSPLFIFSAAFLLYASYSFVLMLFADYFRAAPIAVREELWGIHNVLNVLKNLAIARMFYLQKKKQAT